MATKNKKCMRKVNHEAIWYDVALSNLFFLWVGLHAVLWDEPPELPQNAVKAKSFNNLILIADMSIRTGVVLSDDLCLPKYGRQFAV